MVATAYSASCSTCEGRSAADRGVGDSLSLATFSVAIELVSQLEEVLDTIATGEPGTRTHGRAIRHCAAMYAALGRLGPPCQGWGNPVETDAG